MTIESILLVDDDLNVLRLLEIFLGRTYHIRGCSTLAEAAAALDEAAYTYMVMDLMIDGSPGWGLLKLARDTHPAPRIVVMTGSADPVTRHKALAMGAEKVVNKPSTPAEIQQVLRDLPA